MSPEWRATRQKSTLACQRVRKLQRMFAFPPFRRNGYNPGMSDHGRSLPLHEIRDDQRRKSTLAAARVLADLPAIALLRVNRASMLDRGKHDRSGILLATERFLSADNLGHAEQ
jgi:hypothetical protein